MAKYKYKVIAGISKCDYEDVLNRYGEDGFKLVHNHSDSLFGIMEKKIDSKKSEK
jgi:hypothetical protein